MTSRLYALVLAFFLLGLVVAALAKAHTPAQLLRGFACIHKHEGRWDAKTGNGFYGGYQMDMQFQRDYGAVYLRRFGTADRWPPAVQTAVAILAHISGRGWTPWPNAARRCGLL